MADRFPEQAESDLTCLVDQKNDDRIIGYRKITWFVSVSQINKWFARYWQITIFAQLRSIIVDYFELNLSALLQNKSNLKNCEPFAIC